MHRHGWLITCAVLLSFPATMAAQNTAVAGEDGEPTDERLRELEAKYEETGEAKYLFERALTLEQMGEYQFALEIIEKHREGFEDDPDVDGVSVAEQRLRRRLDEGAGGDDGRPRRDGPGPLDWTLVGAGAGALAGGVTTMLIAEQRAKRLRCSPVSQGADASGCSGVQPYTGLTRREFDAKTRGVRTLRVVGIGLGTVGLGLATWGIVRMAQGTDRARSPDGQSALQFRPVLVWEPNELKLSLEMRF